MLSILFSLLFPEEFFKVNQECFEESMVHNLVQVVRLPFITIGLIVIVYRFHRSKYHDN